MAILGIGCKSLTNLEAKQRNKTLYNWQKTITDAASEVRDQWAKSQDGDWSFYQDFGIDISDADIADLELVPVVKYNLDSLAFFNYNKELPLNGLLTLDKTRAAFYVKKGGNIIVAINSDLRNGAWKSRGSGPVTFKGHADRLKELLSAKRDIIFIDIYNSLNRRSIMGYVAVNDGKQFMVIEQNGSLYPLSERILSLRETFSKPKN